MPKKRLSVGQTIGGIVVGLDQQIFRTTPPANELVAKGTPLRAVAAEGGGTITVGLPDDAPILNEVRGTTALPPRGRHRSSIG
jgi:hypothetical protein